MHDAKGGLHSEEMLLRMRFQARKCDERVCPIPGDGLDCSSSSMMCVVCVCLCLCLCVRVCLCLCVCLCTYVRLPSVYAWRVCVCVCVGPCPPSWILATLTIKRTPDKLRIES